MVRIGSIVSNQLGEEENMGGAKSAFEVVVEDVVCSAAEFPLAAKYYRPAASGEFPAVVSVHGGAWTSGDSLSNASLDQAMAAAGIAVLAIDFRLAPKFPYPASVADVNFAIRWLKAKARDFQTRPEWVGGVGTSSGGHQLLLAALQPHEPDFLALTAPQVSNVDASIGYAVACWPISDPLTRYRMAKERGVQRLVTNHDAYFGSEEVMSRANPQLILERNEPVHLPSLLLLQGTKDDNVTPDMAARLARSYEARGGKVVFETFEDQPHMFVTKDPASAASVRAVDLITRFVQGRGKLAAAAAA
jgi:acetyl esterase/lipase